MESSSQPFSYQPLDNDSIRLITIKPGPWDSIIECEIRVEKLHQCKDRFGALSYVWGDSNIRRAIRLNGSTFKVTVNLFEGLRQIRESMFEDETLPQLPIWVDAICINQDDKVEKKNQIPNMHQIYSTAQEVFLWLGVMPIPFDFFKSWTYNQGYSWIDFDDKDRSMSEELREEALKRYIVYVRSPQFPVQTLSRQFPGEPRKQQLMHFAVASALRNCPYFQRLWTVQEALFAKNGPVILVNRHVLTWDELTHKDHLEPDESVEVLSHPHTSFFGISLFREQAAIYSRRSPPERLLSVIQHFSELACSETVDKIYGLLAIVPLHDLPLSLWPDYSIPSEEVHWRYARYIFAETGTPDLLERYTKPLPGVPSWVPAIGARERNIPVTKSISFARSGPAWWMYPEFSADSREMCIKGFDCGVCEESMERPLAVARPKDLQLVGTGIDLRDTLSQLGKKIDPNRLAWGEVTGTQISFPDISSERLNERTLFQLAEELDLREMQEYCSRNQDIATRALEGWREIAALAWTSLRTSKGEIFTFRDSLWLDEFQPRKGDRVFRPNGMKGALVLHPAGNGKFRIAGRLTTRKGISNEGERLQRVRLI
ncbi:hypothetical protein Neosp_012224 [[Neocosmospora] mangrovei]